VGLPRLPRRIRLAPGVYFNVNRRSIGISGGVRGARWSIKSDGRQTRGVGIPGSGLYYRSRIGPRRRRRLPDGSLAVESTSTGASILAAIVVVAIVVAVVAVIVAATH
jgi:hypothetical protein